MGSKKQLDKVVEKDHPELFCINVTPPDQEISGLEIVRKWKYTWHPKTIFLYTLNVRDRILS